MSDQYIISEAQEFILVTDPAAIAPHDFHDDQESPLEVLDMSQDHKDDLEVTEPHEIEIVIEDLPGAPPGTKDPEPEPDLVVEDREDENEASKTPKKNEKWDWESKGATGFVAWIKERISSVPKHSGFDSAGLERAIAYLDRLDNEISKAMRLDLDGDLDANKVEEVRSQIDDGISRLQQRIDKVKKTKKSNRKKKADETPESLIKEAQKINGTSGPVITVPLLISGIARVCINGSVSAGHDINHIFQDQVKKYSLNDRERSEVKWLLFDMGYAIRGDRGFMPDEEVDETSSDNYDFMANYKG
jgi:hypothetical protein